MKLSKRVCILIGALTASLTMTDPADATPAPQAEPSVADSNPTASPLATQPVTADEPPVAAPVPDKGLITRIVEGGWVMWPIGACSVLTLYLIGNGIYHTLGRRVAPAEHKEALKHLFIDGKYAESYGYCLQHPTSFTNVVKAGIGALGEGKLATEEAITGEIAKENAKLQTEISYLSVIGVCTPMIGLLGTVTGMIRAFSTLGANGIGDPSSLSSAIGEVLVATASGLFIAIPAFGAYYFLRNRAVAAMHSVQDTVADFFRKMPYESMDGVQIGEKDLIAGEPSWLRENQGSTSPAI
jgi:biopolymer transport protein ExbB